MTLWLVRAGRAGEREQDALKNGLAIVGWSRLGDLSSIASREQLSALLELKYPGSNRNRIANFTSQIWAFLRRIQEGDLVAMPSKFQATIAIGRITGPYRYRTDLSPDSCNTRPVQWIRTDVPRTAFQQDLLYSFGAFMTVCEISRNNAEERVRAVLSGKQDTIVKEQEQGIVTAASDEMTPSTILPQEDLERTAYDQIQEAINRHFKGHELARLVEAVLQSEGYVTRRSPPGRDGGVDILAGRGPFGFDSPKICVQVKSENSALDADELRKLKGILNTFSAEQGLLVGWGGFNRALLDESKQSFFNVRLWDSDALIQAILRNYERLSDEIKAELPLKRIWSLVPQEE